MMGSDIRRTRLGYRVMTCYGHCQQLSMSMIGTVIPSQFAH